MTFKEIRSSLLKHKNQKRALHSVKFFKTGPGEYSEGDVFYGLRVAYIRAVAKQYSIASFSILKKLLYSKIHEERLLALIILDSQYQSAVKAESVQDQKKIFEFLIKNRSRINNWDLVDTISCGTLGHYLYVYPGNKKIFISLIKSKSLWDRRIAMIASFYFIKQNQFDLTLKLSELVLGDQEDLMHKAAGWMLREVGKRDQKILIKFLDQNVKKMPRTMLRYSIEKFSPKIRTHYLNS